MASPTRDEVLIKLDQVDTALEAPDADRAAILRDADGWLGANPSIEPADALYYRERLQAIRQRHGAPG